MIPAGYMCKYVASRPDWIKADTVVDIYSLSNCISSAFADPAAHWKHNGYWLYDSPDDIREIADNAGIDLAKTTLFYYEVFEFEFNEDLNEWQIFSPELSFTTNVQQPEAKQLVGFDVATFSTKNSPECSPLSCNALATAIPVNGHCLFESFKDAKGALDKGLFENSEPGPYRIFAVYNVS